MADLEVTDVRKEFPTRSDPLVVLKDVSLKMSAGDNLAIVGPSGVGKSTLLHIIGTLDTPTSGQVRLNGQDPFALNEAELAHFRNHNIGFIFQEHHLLPQLTALENVLIPTIAEGKADQDTIERARYLLERVDLSDRLDHRPAELAGGERERVAVARALIQKPSLLLADEPTGNLDRRTADEIAQLLLELQSLEKNMLVVVTHSTKMAELLQSCLSLDDGLLES